MLIVALAVIVCMLEIATKGYMFFLLAPLSLLCLPFFLALQLEGVRREALSPHPGKLRRARVGQLAAVVTFYIVVPGSSGAFSGPGAPVTQFGFVPTIDGSGLSLLATILALLATLMMVITTANLVHVIVTDRHRRLHAA